MKCIFCGGQIRKATTVNWVKTEADRMPWMSKGLDSFSRYHFPLVMPKTKADCQKLTNDLVVSVQRGNDGTVRSFGSWDGETYVDNFFCNGDHARKFAYAAARAGWRRTRQ